MKTFILVKYFKYLSKNMKLLQKSIGKVNKFNSEKLVKMYLF